MSCVLFLTATTWLTMYCNQSVNVSRRLLARYSGKILIAADGKIKEARHVSARVKQVSDRFHSK